MPSKKSSAAKSGLGTAIVLIIVILLLLGRI